MSCHFGLDADNSMKKRKKKKGPFFRQFLYQRADALNAVILAYVVDDY